ncbi:MAG: hypothetical protein SV760_02240 [Halobacteria archaeon]|nr:hypothetical protein [Halobacteria archaeon]
MTGSKAESSEENSEDEGDIVVTERAYKAASVFTTLVSIALIFVGFLFIDSSIGWPTKGKPNALTTTVGILFILSAAGLYIFSLRFKTKEEKQHGR